MSKLLHAAETLRKEVNRLKALTEAVDALESFGKLEHAASELEARHKSLQRDVAAATEEAERARSAATEAQRQAEDAIAAANARKAKQLAEIEEEGERRRQTLIERKQSEFAAADRDAADRMAALEAEEVSLNARVGAARNELAELNDKIADARKTVARMLSGA